MRATYLPRHFPREGGGNLCHRLRFAVAASALVAAVASCAVGVDAVHFDAATSGTTEPPADVSLARFERSTDGGYDDDFLLFGARWPTETITVDVGQPPDIELPDLEHITNPSALVHSELGDLVSDPIEGIEVVACEDEGLQAAEPDGPSILSEETDDGVSQLRVDETGAGEFYSLDTGNLVTIAVNDDGTGEYFNEAPERLTTVKISGAGTGEYFDRLGSNDDATNDDVTAAEDINAFETDSDELFTLTVDSNGTARQFHKTVDHLETVKVHADGSAEHYVERGDADEPVTVTSTIVFADGAWETRHSIGDDFIELVVHADGSGTYADSAIGRANFDADGFGEKMQITVPPTPTFLVDVQFPPLGQLGQVAATCETVIRVDQSLLFDSGSAVLNTSAGEVLHRLVATLNTNGRSITIAGHTDAAGSDESNQQLSIDRAEMVQAVMAVQGLRIDSTVVGFGESEPIADNYLPDGSADVDGMASNRRVEILIND